MTKKKSVLEKIEQEREKIIQFAKNLVQFPSVYGEEGDIQNFVANKLKEMGLEVDMWEPDLGELKKHPWFVPVDKDWKGRPNVVGKLDGSGEGRSIILNGHIDVVPVENEDRWKYGPWSGTVEKGKLYGRGAVDMKGGVASMIMAVKSIIKTGISLKGDLILESVLEEEAGGNGTLACSIRGYRADAAIITEPSSTSVVSCANRGAQFFRITVYGEETGIEAKWARTSALEKAILLYHAIDHFSLLRESAVTNTKHYELYEEHKKQRNTVVPTGVCKIQAGAWPSSLPGKCVMEGSLECLPGEDIKEVKKDFKRFLLRVAESDEWLRKNPPSIDWFGLSFESSIAPPDHELVSIVKQNGKTVVGLPPKIVGGGGSDLRCLTKYAQTPAFIFGPGGGGFHGVDEFLDLDELINVTKILALTILDWCGYEKE